MTLLALACGLAGCGSNLPAPTTATTSRSYLPNIAQIQTAISQSVLTRYHVPMTALCPTVVPEITGETFSCIAYSPKAKHLPLAVLVTEHGGTYVSYRQTG